MCARLRKRSQRLMCGVRGYAKSEDDQRGGSHRHVDCLRAPLLALDAHFRLWVVCAFLLAPLGENDVRRVVQFLHSLVYSLWEHSQNREALRHALAGVLGVRIVLDFLRAQ